MAVSPYEPWETPTPTGGYPPGFDPYGQQPRRSSGMGTASLILGIATLLLMAVPFGYGIYLGVEAAAKGHASPQLDESDPMVAVMGCAAMLGLLTALVGLGLGIAGVSQRGRTKWPAITGLVICGLVLFLMLASIVLNLLTGGFPSA